MIRCRFLLALTACLPAIAAAGPIGVAPFLEMAVSRDDNLFRVEEGAAGGPPLASDSIERGTVGIVAEWPVSRQKLTVGGEVSERRYDRFSALDHSEHEVRARLEFETVGPLYGTLSYTDVKRADDFSDRDSSELNFVSTRNPELRAYYEMSPAWRLRGELGQERRDQSLASQDNFDRRENRALLGVEHMGRPGSILGVGVELLDGEFPNRVEGGFLAPRFRQVSAFVNADWAYSGVSRISGRVGLTEREPEGGGQDRDFSGVTGELGYTRIVSAKSRLTLDLQRQIFSVDNVDANFVRQTGASLGWLWRYSPKLEGRARYSYRELDYQAVSGSGADERRDIIDAFVAELTYRPWSVLALILDFEYEDRDSNRDDESFDVLRGGFAMRFTLDTDE